MNDQQRLFEQTLSDARGVISPIEKIHRQVALPSVQDMEIAVRQWLAGRIERERNAIAVKSAERGGYGSHARFPRATKPSPADCHSDVTAGQEQ